MKTTIVLTAMCLVYFAGCSNKQKEEQLQQELSLAKTEQAALRNEIAERDAYFEDVMQAVNSAYSNLERARIKESQVMQQTESSEGTLVFTNNETRQRMLTNINDIGNALKDDWQTITDLQKRAKGFRVQIASLNTLIDNMKKSLKEREESIAALDSRVRGLEDEVAEKSHAIAVKDMTIEDQQRTINRAYYIVGTREELEEKGIIQDEGGFLWGLLGSTTVVSSKFDPTQYTAVDKTREQTIHVGGEIDEVLPLRASDSYAMTTVDENTSDLSITSPGQFWKTNYLVIVLD